MPTCHNAIFFRRGLFARFGGFSERYKVASDYEWLVRTHGVTTTAFVKEDVVFYLKGGFSDEKHIRSLLERGEVAFSYFGAGVLVFHICNFLKIIPVYLLKRILIRCGLFDLCYYLLHKRGLKE